MEVLGSIILFIILLMFIYFDRVEVNERNKLIKTIKVGDIWKYKCIDNDPFIHPILISVKIIDIQMHYVKFQFSDSSTDSCTLSDFVGIRGYVKSETNNYV